MVETDKKIKIIIGSLIVGVCFIIGFLFAYVYQPAERTMQIYSNAMKDYANKDYQNSYYLFSRVSFLSNLKPFAIYHQALCAKELGDKKSEMKQYQLLFNNYTKNKLSLKAKYFAAQMLIEDEPNQAKRYFEQIIKDYPDSDYAIAAEYYLGVILLNKYKNGRIFPMSVKDDIEMSFRHYLKKAPHGRLALNAVENWLTLDKEIAKDDYLLMAKSYYLFGDYENAKKLLANTDLKESWVLDVKNSYALKNYARAKYLAQYGLQNYTAYVDESDIHDTVDIFIDMSSSKTDAINLLYNLSAPKGKDYIWSLKCEAAPVDYQAGCYRQLYLNFPKGRYAPLATANLFFDRIKARDFENAAKIGKDFLNKYENNQNAPMVMFWLGKIAEHKNNYDDYMFYYKSTIANYPDTYYAYRAYLAMKHIKTSILNAYIKEQPVEYPYPNVSKNDVIFKLAELKDYDLMMEITEDDFIKSWIYYQKGDYSHSMLVARDAMEKIYPKPERTDLRWRLVYPIDYYDEIQKYAHSVGNDAPLMLALVREESYFNPDAKSSVGARGLMQLMPATAKEISAHYGYGLTDEDDLYKPELNIKIGNTYYAQLRSMLNNLDISAIAAYNGGIGSIGRWKKNLNYADTDEFVEQIPYPETKNYVKKVFRSYWNYLRIYIDE